ncbi:MAG: hypothetical protein HZA91_06940 [Verrucomicrobia bacterium]|nr:hypothetical protein [Verrucomicrobiota bacterium]
MNRMSFVAIAAALLLAACAAAPAQTFDPSHPAWLRAVNLMPLIDPAHDTVAGQWTASGGVLTCAPERFARIEIPFEPPEEYDFAITFCRQDGRETVAQFISHRGRPQMWNMACDHSTAFGFDVVAGKPATDNSTTFRPGTPLENGRGYRSVLQVRSDGVRAYLDGRLICHWRTDYRDASVTPRWQLRRPNVLGVGAYQATTTFQRIELLEITGKGRVVPRAGAVKPK